MIIEDYFSDLMNQRYENLKEYFHPDAKIYWPVTGEEFTVEEFIEVNSKYPGDWKGELESLNQTTEGYVYSGRVYNNSRSQEFFVIGFSVNGDGKIIRLIEYWAEKEEAPNWRKQLHIGKKIL